MLLRYSVSGVQTRPQALTSAKLAPASSGQGQRHFLCEFHPGLPFGRLICALALAIVCTAGMPAVSWGQSGSTSVARQQTSISGIVVDADGNPVEGLPVVLRSLGRERRTQTKSNGGVEFQEALSGPLARTWPSPSRVQVNDFGGKRIALATISRGGSAGSVRLILEPAVQVNVRVKDEAGAGLAQVAVTFECRR
jgi:hypothetical protein